MNGDGLLNSLDVDAFVAYLTGGQGATGMRAAYAWDAENRLISVTPTAPQAGDKKLVFAYDYLGRRIEKQVFDWDDQAADWQATPSVQRKFVWGGTDAGGWLLLMELDGSDNLVRKYTWGLDLAGQHGSVNSLESAGGIGGLLAVAQAQVGGGSASGGVDAGEYVFTYDANGNVAQVLDLSAGSAAAAIVAHYEYDPYGGVVNDLSGYTYAEANPIRFSTKYWDAETGLGHWGYRYYSPRLGRWLSRDRIADLSFGFVTEGVPYSVHGAETRLYAFCRNEPVTRADGVGLSDECCVCGPDISMALWRMQLDIGWQWKKLDKAQKDSLCKGYRSEAAKWDSQLYTRATSLRTANCPKGKPCEYDHSVPGASGGISVTVCGSCHASFDVNYVVWGTMRQFCNGFLADAKFKAWKYPWPLSSNTRERYDHAWAWTMYGTHTSYCQRRRLPDAPSSLQVCKPCSEQWPGTLDWKVYGLNGVRIGRWLGDVYVK
jgi:RHS repeat-associated protein